MILVSMRKIRTESKSRLFALYHLEDLMIHQQVLFGSLTNVDVYV
jgi:hypothetical protein